MYRILIIGNDGYLGSNIENWLKRKPLNYNVTGICIRNIDINTIEFSKYDCIVDTVGIAHIKPKKKYKKLFYSVNRDLTITLCKKAQNSGVKQFIFISSMNVFGDYCGVITSVDNPKPSSFYGDSKLQADMCIQSMNGKNFKVVSIRPPAVYGKGCKGNFNKLIKYEKAFRIFPEFSQKKSMIYVVNLCEFIRLLIDNQCSGVFYPQNREYTSTSQIIKTIAEVNGDKIYFTKIFNLILKCFIKKFRIVNRAFADDAYEKKISNYFEWQYCIVDFYQSIKNSII